MQDKDKAYSNTYFNYNYPFTWDKRNKNYLKKVYDKKIEKEFIVPMVFRLRFYTEDHDLISDTFYTPNNTTILFPNEPEIEDKTFIGWVFLNDASVLVTVSDYLKLKEAVLSGEDNIELIAYYK